jgi:hypothetical protein
MVAKETHWRGHAAQVTDSVAASGRLRRPLMRYHARASLAPRWSTTRRGEW